VFLDQVKLHLKAGKGGDGASSFSRRANRIIGNGGDGGRGADIILRTDPNLYDLNKFRHKKRFFAPSGERGGPSNKKGRSAKPLFIDVPPGCLVKDLEGNPVVDLKAVGQEFLIACGGRGGKGNYKRDYAQEGENGEEKEVILDYRVLCDVAILGFPNVGKTSLFNALTGEAHRVASFPFTTIHCSWAVCEPYPYIQERDEYNFKRFILLDTPPLKDKPQANDWEGFLKHLYRAKILLLLTDDPKECRSQIRKIKEKIAKFDQAYLNKKFFYLLNKIDKIDKEFKIKGFICISCKEGWGLDLLIKKIEEFFLDDI
jgi:GTP-binding protein